MTCSQNTILRPLRQPRIRKEARGRPTRLTNIGLLKLLQERLQTIHASLDVFRRDRIAQTHKIRRAKAAARHDRDQALFQQKFCKVITAADDLTIDLLSDDLLQIHHDVERAAWLQAADAGHGIDAAHDQVTALLKHLPDVYKRQSIYRT